MSNKNENGQELLKKIAEGDEKAFGILFYQYLPVLQSFALKFTKSEHGTEEIIQDSFLKIWLNRDKLEEVENVKAYLYKYVSNECLNYLRKTLRQTKTIDTFKTRHSDHNNDTVDTIHLNEINKIINAAIANLPAQRKKIYELSRLESKTIPEIAEILNLSPSTVKNALVIALKSIRAHLSQHGITFSILMGFGFLDKIFFR
ncbi:RNA polymerase sigma factor [Pedobacter punctiformis]|uniref:RNA polymerase sigma-70 factor n=1 Tax=Pedobacter punctiformis TaxID=3004097 RepID=A0ABT4LEE3_9SPHI|nr:RNA polymerase sigma-70 factor [Pedobacter sp. HCMS5-2]MCZ4245219.1 RNA polymerase sigma-70 factor [Pedobacter sp. HCMS5-2]